MNDWALHQGGKHVNVPAHESCWSIYQMASVYETNGRTHVGPEEA